MPRHLFYCLILPLTLLMAGCSPLSALNLVTTEAGYRLEEGLAYAAGPRHRLDLYLPEAPRGDGTVILFFYGGNWRSGDRGDYRFVGQAFAAEGYLVVIPDYRLYPEVRFPDFVEDGAKAAAWVKREIGAWGGNSDRIVLAGHSAGGHIAALLAFDRRYLEEAGAKDMQPLALVGLAGPYAFDPLGYASTRPIFEDFPRPEAMRPIAAVTPAAPASLLLHGDNDRTVFPWNSEQLERRLTEAGVRVEYLPLSDIGHAGILLALADPFQNHAPVVLEIDRFLGSL